MIRFDVANSGKSYCGLQTFLQSRTKTNCNKKYVCYNGGEFIFLKNQWKQENATIIRLLINFSSGEFRVRKDQERDLGLI